MTDCLLPAIIVLAACATPAAGLPPHPRLLLDAKGIAELKHKIDGEGWANVEWESLKKEADRLLSEKVELPPRGGNWYHYYACPTHGDRLKTGKRTGPWQWEHICPVDGEVLRGDPKLPSRDYDGCAISFSHQARAKSTRDLGVAYQISGGHRYADKAREILLAYAAKYPAYPLHNNQGKPKVGGGRAGSQSLDESVWLIPLCQGMDLIWDVLTEEDRRSIADRVLLPAVTEVILPHKMGVHNIQCWKNSAVGLVGFLLGDRGLIDTAIEDAQRGYRAQMATGVTADGAWYEGAWGYHFYTMNALWPLTEAARNCGIDLYGPEFKRMFDAPLKFAMPNLRLPAFSDSGEPDLNKSNGIYELAYARYQDSNYLRLLHGRKRDSDYAFWYGEPELPAPPPEDRKSANYPATGHAILTKGNGEDATWLCFKYGPYGGGHGHPDKLSFVLYSHGCVVALDPGTALYGLPIQQGWYKTSLAHNTLVVDEASQQAVDGKLISFGSEKGVDYTVADAGDIYDGVRWVRTIALLDQNLLVVLDQVSAKKPVTVDIAYHQQGRWVDTVAGDPWTPPDKPGYSYLRDAKIRDMKGQVSLATSLGDERRVAVKIDAGSGGAKLVTATGVTSDTQDRVPCAIVRNAGTQSTVIWALALDGKPACIERIESDAVDGLPGVACRVTSAGGQTWAITGGVEAGSLTARPPRFDGCMAMCYHRLR